MKYSGYIGFSVTKETSPSVSEEITVPKKYTGDVIRNVQRFKSADKVIDDITIANEISIVADDYLTKNLPYMKWVSWMGSKWKISSIDVQFPRINITVGDLYNG